VRDCELTVVLMVQVYALWSYVRHSPDVPCEELVNYPMGTITLSAALRVWPLYNDYCTCLYRTLTRTNHVGLLEYANVLDELFTLMRHSETFHKYRVLVPVRVALVRNCTCRTRLLYRACVKYSVVHKLVDIFASVDEHGIGVVDEERKFVLYWRVM